MRGFIILFYTKSSKFISFGAFGFDEYVYSFVLIVINFSVNLPVVTVFVTRFSLLTVLFLFSTAIGGSLEKSGGLILAGRVRAFIGFGLPLQSGVVAFISERIFFLPTYWNCSAHILK